MVTTNGTEDNMKHLGRYLLCDHIYTGATLHL